MDNRTGNFMKEKGIKMMSEALAINTSLVFLDLSCDNKITKQVVLNNVNVNVKQVIMSKTKERQ